jgi:hypothetical protein
MLAYTRFSQLLHSAICVALAVVVCVGCGQPKPTPTSAAPTQAPANETGEIQFRSTQQAHQSLAGLWLGKAVINEGTLKSLLSEMTPPQQQALIKESQTFVSTQMAMQLAIDGSMETAIEVTPVGAQPIQGQTFARWTVVQAKGNQVIVETRQQNENGQATNSQTAYTMSPDGNRIVMQANVGSDLAKCEPLIYLDRQIDERFAEAPNGQAIR